MFAFSEFPARQVSGKNEKGQYILSVLVKRTYLILKSGQCIPAGDSLPLEDDFTFYPHNPNLIDRDTDTVPFKLLTDFVVKGSARAIRPMPQFTVEVHVANNNIKILAIGKRRASMVFNSIIFSEPEFVQEVPLRYDYAYGGRDAAAESAIELPPKEYVQHLPPEMDLLAGNLTRYPRNPEGKGYLVEKNRDAIEQLELPNLEDPEDRLTPARLIPPSLERWFDQPIPRATDWVNPTWFPRLAYFGFYHAPEGAPANITEVSRRWAEENIMAAKQAGDVHFRACNSASLGLQIPYLTGGTQCRLVNIHPLSPDFLFKLPEQFPKIWVDGRKGKLLETKPVIHSVVVEPDVNCLSIVWRGAAPAIRPYFDEELKEMPFKVEW